MKKVPQVAIFFLKIRIVTKNSTINIQNCKEENCDAKIIAVIYFHQVTKSFNSRKNCKKCGPKASENLKK